MKVLISPTYFPTIAHFVAIANSKHVILEAHDNFQKQTYRNRGLIYAANGVLLLNIPTKHSKDGSKIAYRNTEIENIENWQKQHWKSIESAYKSSPFFEFYEDDIKPLFYNPQYNLYELNTNILKVISECIELDYDVSVTQDYITNYDSTNLIDLRDLAIAKKGIHVNLEPYTQVFADKHGYKNNLCILDLLFNEGPNTLNYLESQHKFW